MAWELVVPMVVVAVPVVALVLTRRRHTEGAPGTPDSADRSVLHCAAPVRPTAPRTDPAR
jgi:hypothetical protein